MYHLKIQLFTFIVREHLPLFFTLYVVPKSLTKSSLMVLWVSMPRGKGKCYKLWPCEREVAIPYTDVRIWMYNAFFFKSPSLHARCGICTLLDNPVMNFAQNWFLATSHVRKSLYSWRFYKKKSYLFFLQNLLMNLRKKLFGIIMSVFWLLCVS